MQPIPIDEIAVAAMPVALIVFCAVQVAKECGLQSRVAAIITAFVTGLAASLGWVYAPTQIFNAMVTGIVGVFIAMGLWEGAKTAIHNYDAGKRDRANRPPDVP